MHYHRPLTTEDVETANRLLEAHQPLTPDSRGRSVCAGATHLTATTWPCARYHWAAGVLAAHERGEIT